MNNKVYHFRLTMDAFYATVDDFERVEDCRVALRQWIESNGAIPSYYRAKLKEIKAQGYCKVALPGMGDFPTVFGYDTCPCPAMPTIFEPEYQKLTDTD